MTKTLSSFDLVNNSEDKKAPAPQEWWANRTNSQVSQDKQSRFLDRQNPWSALKAEFKKIKTMNTKNEFHYAQKQKKYRTHRNCSSNLGQLWVVRKLRVIIWTSSIHVTQLPEDQSQRKVLREHPAIDVGLAAAPMPKCPCGRAYLAGTCLVSEASDKNITRFGHIQADGNRKAEEKANRPFPESWANSNRADSLLSISTVQEVSLNHTHSGFSVLISLKSKAFSYYFLQVSVLLLGN